MQALRVFSVVPKLPPRLEVLWDIAHNLWFSWNNELTNIFTSIDHSLWVACEQNPIELLNRLPQRRIEELSRDDFFLQRLADAKRSLDHYLVRRHSPFKFPSLPDRNMAVAYFSLEYGIAMCLPIYSGGLGVLAGDHLKSASDLNVPLVAMGLFYREGYFRQYMTPDGWQQERYPDHDFEQMPVKPALGLDGKPARITLDLAGQPLHARIWLAQVGKVRLFLLDTNLPENSPEFRQITARLYGGGLEMRLWQEILLGIGGIKALSVLGIEPMVIHMNEGHSAFAGLERIRVYMQDHGLTFEAATELTASSSVFTTHTPVPAGNDRFPVDLMRTYFEGYAGKLGLAFKVFMALGREDQRDDSELFCMTVLALRLSRFSNGVSKLHGEVSRRMWQKVWPNNPVEDVPIGSITNGIHAATWVSKDMATLYALPGQLARGSGLRPHLGPGREHTGRRAVAHPRAPARTPGGLRTQAPAQAVAGEGRPPQGSADRRRGAGPASPDHRLRPALRNLQAGQSAAHGQGALGAPAQRQRASRAVHLRGQGPPQRQRGQEDHPGIAAVVPPRGLPPEHGLS